MSGIDWNAIGTGLGGVILGVGSVSLWLRQREVSNARQGAEVNVIDMMREEMTRLSARMAAAETRERRLIHHIYQLENVLRAAGLTPPAFNIEPDMQRPDSA